MIYLDYMSTTPVDRRVARVMQSCLTVEGDFGNPASQHAFGLRARNRIANASEQVAALINADPKEIIWTSGATESINLALKGVAQFYQRQGKHIITMRTEHKAVLNTCRYLESIGFEVTYLSPESNGLLDIKKLEAAIRPDTILASIMHVNNETGIIQDIANIGKLLREKGVWFHVDAAQSAGKIAIDLKNMPVDLMSFSSHKIYGPKGMGALYVRRSPRVQLIAQLHGGDQENPWRAGTLPTHHIVGMGEAFAIAHNEMQKDAAHSDTLRNIFLKKIATLPGVHFNGDLTHQIAHCFNIRFDAMDAETVLKQLPELAISTGSACNSVDPEPSHVLMAMGLSRVQANHSVRISFGRFTTIAEMNAVVEYLTHLIFP